MIDGVMPVSHGETYSCPMSTTVSMSKARSTLPHLVDQARHDTVFLTKRGHTVGVLLSPDAYERMSKALNDADDVVRAAYRSTDVMTRLFTALIERTE